MFEPHEIAERIKKCAKEKGITVKALLESSGVGGKMVSNMSGKNGSYPQSDKIAKIASNLNCSIDYLLGLSDNPKQSIEIINQSEQCNPDEQRKRLLDNYDKINKDGKAELVGLSEIISGNPKYLKADSENNKIVS